MRVLSFVLLLQLCHGIQLQADFSEGSWKQRPIAKVVKLLKEMSSALAEEGEKDQEMYDKLACWCGTNEKAKTKAIEWAEQKIPEEQATIDELTAKASRLETEIGFLKEDIPKAQKGLAEATEMREQESAEFSETEKETISTIATLKGAVEALKKHNAASAFTQKSEALVHRAISHHSRYFGERGLANMMKRVKTMLAQEQRMGYTRGVDAYQPASGQIFGILEQMKETFESNLDTARKEEASARKEFAELSASKEQEIESAQADLTNKESDLATAAETSAMTKESLADNQANLNADKESLANLQKQCERGDQEFDARTKSRTQEIQAISETVGILTDDDARDLMSRATGFFIQTSSRVTLKAKARTQEKQRRDIASWVLTHTGRRNRGGNGAGMIQLGVQAKENAIGEVTKAVDKMIVDVVQQRKDDYETHEQCKADLAQNARDTDSATKAKNEAATTGADLTASINTLSDEIATLNGEVSDMQSEIKRASETREAENKEFQQSIADQRATQQILAKAMDRMAAFYKSSLLQAGARRLRRQAPPGALGGPPEQATYKKNAGGNTIITLLEMIIEDSKRTEAEFIEAEQESQKGYESFVSDSNAGIAVCQKDIMNKSEESSRLEAERLRAQRDEKESDDNLASYAEVANTLHGKCDFLVKNFAARQDGQSQEIEALKGSVAILEGQSFTALLQGKGSMLSNDARRSIGTSLFDD